MEETIRTATLEEEQMEAFKDRLNNASVELKVPTPKLYTPTLYYFEKFLKENNLKPNGISFQRCCTWYTKKINEGEVQKKTP